MGFLKINTNIASMNAHVSTAYNNKSLDDSLEKLSSGLRINKAADDSSGMAIADSLRAQARGLGQAIRNANDAIGVIQIADKAMDEQVKIVETIRTKAIQAAQDSQTRKSREAIQRDIVRLIEQLDNIALQTSFNGQKLLAGSFVNREFQIGAFSNETVKASIGSTMSSKIGGVRFETTDTITKPGVSKLQFRNPKGGADIKLESVKIGHKINEGVGALANTINRYSQDLGVRATWSVQTTGSTPVKGGILKGLYINGISIGNISKINDNDGNGNLVTSINKYSMQTGVTASTDIQGQLNLTSVDGRGIVVSALKSEDLEGNEITAEKLLGIAGVDRTAPNPTATPKVAGDPVLPDADGLIGNHNYGRLTLINSGSNDIMYKVRDAANDPLNGVINDAGTEAYANLSNIAGTFDIEQAKAAGAFPNDQYQALFSMNDSDVLGSGVSTSVGAQMSIDIADAAISTLDAIRSDLGSVQNQLVVTINNISVTQVNVKASESTIRDVDFSRETANFSKRNILAQSGSYALSQANQAQQNVLKLLQ